MPTLHSRETLRAVLRCGKAGLRTLWGAGGVNSLKKPGLQHHHYSGTWENCLTSVTLSPLIGCSRLPLVYQGRPLSGREEPLWVALSERGARGARSRQLRSQEKREGNGGRCWGQGPVQERERDTENPLNRSSRPSGVPSECAAPNTPPGRSFQGNLRQRVLKAFCKWAISHPL